MNRSLDVGRPLPGDNCVLAHGEELEVAVVLAAEVLELPYQT